MRRADPYEERARALALAAGLDPDARIERPGLRSMPTWCTFRDAARAPSILRAETRPRPPPTLRIRAAVAGISERPAQGVRPPRRGDRRPDAQLHVGRQCRGRRHLCRRPCPAAYAQPGRRRHRLREADQHFGSGLRHRLPETWRCASVRPLRPSRTAVGTIIKDVARVISFGIGRTFERRARRPRPVR